VQDRVKGYNLSFIRPTIDLANTFLFNFSIKAMCIMHMFVCTMDKVYKGAKEME